jgi:hypothetical protein
MATQWRSISFLNFSAALVGAVAFGVGIAPVNAQVVILQQQQVLRQTNFGQTHRGVSFTYSNPAYVSPIYGPIYPRGVSGYPRTVYAPGVNRSVLINPTIVNSPIYNSTVINPTIVSPIYGYPYGNTNTVILIDRPTPQIVVDPQYGVRFKEQFGY